MEVKTFKKNLAGKEIIVETGKMANFGDSRDERQC